MKKRVYIFGTGSFALRRLKQYRREYEIVAFLDNNVLKQGKLFEGLPVQSPVDSDWSAIDAVVIASSQFESIFAQLLSTGLPAEKLVLPLEVTRRQFVRLFESTAFPLLHVLLLALGGLKLFEIFFS
jgi:hypothetical protein